MTPAPRMFDPPVSTSNLVAPPRDRLMGYARAVRDGQPVVSWLETRLASFHDAAHCITLCSGFWALVIAIRTLVLPGRSDVLMPSLTYRRLADVIAWAGLRPRFCEVDATSLAASPATLRAALAPDVGLLLAVHPIVGTCDAPGIEDLARQVGLPLLFDSVESVFEHVNGRKVGSFGAAECFSLHASKLLNGAEGGYVTTNDEALAHRLVALRDGTAVGGMDARLNRLHAAMAMAALDDLADQVARNRGRYALYAWLLSSVPGLRLLPFDAGSSCKTVVVELTDAWRQPRAETLARLNARGVLARAYYHPPLHAKPMAYPHVPAVLPQTDRLAERFMLLPCGHHVGDDDIAAIVALLADQVT